MSLLLQQIQEQITFSLNQIAKILPSYKVTLVARYVGGDLENADIILSNDDLKKVIDSVERMKVQIQGVAEQKSSDQA